MYLTYEKADNTEMLNYQNDGLLHSQNYMNGGKKETVNVTLYANKGLGNLPLAAQLTTTCYGSETKLHTISFRVKC